MISRVDAIWSMREALRLRAVHYSGLLRSSLRSPVDRSGFDV